LLQDDDPLNYTSRIDPSLFEVHWHALTSRESKFEEWLDRLAVRNREAFRETLLAAKAEEFLADHRADFALTMRYVQQMLNAVATAQKNAAAQWLAESKSRLAAVQKSITRDGVRIERAVLIDRGVYRGR
jgi:uncharacterized protein YciW